MARFSSLGHYLLLILLGASGTLISFYSNITFARTETILALAIPENDPLLPPSNIDRELSPLEKKRVKTEIEALEIIARENLNQGNYNEAFKLWFRQLRLYRALDLVSEIQALGEVGEVAWQNNLTQELRVISKRLTEIYIEVREGDNLSTEVLSGLGISFERVRDLDNAIAAYKILLTEARQENDFTLEQQYLETLGELYLDKFDYKNAATIYEELTTRSKSDRIINETNNYLLKLIKIYSRLQQPEDSINTKQQLIDNYLQDNNNESVAKIIISLADDYLSLNKTELAIQNYQEAVILSESWQQLAFTSDALNKIATIYRQQENYPLAIDTYQKLLEINTRAYNSFGVLNTCDRLGKLYLDLEDYDSALTVFNRGLTTAISLNYQVEYFSELIEQTNIKMRS